VTHARRCGGRRARSNAAPHPYAAGEAVVYRRLNRRHLVRFRLEFPTCMVAMQGCCGRPTLTKPLAERHEFHLTHLFEFEPGRGARRTDDSGREAARPRADSPVASPQCRQGKVRHGCCVFESATGRSAIGCCGRTRFEGCWRIVVTQLPCPADCSPCHVARRQEVVRWVSLPSADMRGL
jgi:hypothetical protein